LVVDTELVESSGTAEREAALRMAERIEGEQRVTVGADKGCSPPVSLGFSVNFAASPLAGSMVVVEVDDALNLVAIINQAEMAADGDIAVVVWRGSKRRLRSAGAGCIFLRRPWSSTASWTGDVFLFAARRKDRRRHGECSR
jgi:hypothetical protein